MKILVAEDDALSRVLLQKMLKQMGHESVAARDGTEALRLLEGEDAPALAILDWMMPGATGPEICRKIRADKQRTHSYLVLLTSNNRKEDIVEGLQAGADDYIVKPFDEEELTARINVGVRVVALQQELQARLNELEISLANIKRLRGLIPICCNCKKIRSGDDYWRQVEEYIGELGDIQFSHGLCPDCLEKLYPELKGFGAGSKLRGAFGE